MDSYFVILFIISICNYLIVLFFSKCVFYNTKEKSCIKYPVWVYVTLLLSCFFPIVNVALSIILTTIFFANIASEDYLIVNPNIKNWKIILFLIKKV